MLDAKGRAEGVELMRAALCALANPEQAIRELLSVVRQNKANLDWTMCVQRLQEAPR